MALEGYWYLQTSRFNEWASNSIYGFWRLTAKIIVDGWDGSWCGNPRLPEAALCIAKSTQNPGIAAAHILAAWHYFLLNPHVE